MENLNRRISIFLKKLPPEINQLLDTLSVTKQYRKGDWLLRQGEISRRTYLVESGILRKYYIHKDEEITTELFFENDLALCFTSYVSQEPGHEFIQAVTDVQVLALEKQRFDKAKEEHPLLRELDLLLTEHYAAWVEERLFQFRTYDAEQRYRLLLEQQPRMIQEVPLTHIASYLGISPETLSRIRNRIRQ
jgi:CRP-like cAMP-binding protein